MAPETTPVVDRRRTSLKKEPAGKSGFGEMAGSRAAECAAVCCCCPCALVSLAVLVTVKLPAMLCRKAIKKKKKTPLLQRENNAASSQAQQPPSKVSAPEDCPDPSKEAQPMSPLEDQMWIDSYTGFWRNPSGRE